MATSDKDFSQILGTSPKLVDPYDVQQGWYTEFSKYDDQTKRQVAVTVALELIKADISATDCQATYTHKTLENHIEKLSSYASEIMKALD